MSFITTPPGLKLEGDGDPKSAGSVGEAVGRDGSMAEVGLSANPDGAHQVGRHMADYAIAQSVGVVDTAGRVMAFGLAHPFMTRLAK